MRGGYWDLHEAIGWRGTYHRALHGPLTITRDTTPEELEAAMEEDRRPDWVRTGWREELAHVGQVGVCIRASRGLPTLYPHVVVLRFADGWEHECWADEVWFD